MSEKNDNKVPNVPNLRFDKSEAWNKEPLSKYAKKITSKNKTNSIENIICNSAQNGLIQQKDFFDRTIVNNENTENYYVIEQGDFVYNPRKSVTAPYGPVNVYEYENLGIVSPLYLCFKVDGIDKKFLNYYFKSSAWYKYIYENGDSGARHDRVSIKDDVFLAQPIIVPSLTTQNKVASFLSKIDKRIETQSKIIEDLELVKKGISNTVFGDKSVIKESWKTVKLSTILKERKIYDVKDSVYPHATLSKEGISAKTDRYNRDFLVKDEEKEYKITHLNDICYNPANLKFGVICLNTFGDAIFSPIYVTYEIDKKCDPYFISLYLTNPTFIGHIRKYEQGTVYERMAVSSEDFLKGEINLPTYEEQLKIAKTFKSIDEKIAIEQAILDKLKEQKKFLLSNMFI